MGKLISLRQARKTRARAQKRAQSTSNAARSGMTKSEKTLIDARRELETRRLDGHGRDDGET